MVIRNSFQVAGFGAVSVVPIDESIRVNVGDLPLPELLPLEIVRWRKRQLPIMTSLLLHSLNSFL